MRASFLLSVFAFAVLASSCGTRQEAASRSAAAQPVAPATNATNGFSGPWGVDIAQPEPKPGALPLAKQLAVFAGARQAADDLGFSEKTPPDMASGKELFSQSRLLLPEGALEGQQLFGVPTANGWVCPYFVYPDDGSLGDSGPCWFSLRDGIAFSLEGEGSIYRLYGVVANDVRSVSIVAGDRPYESQMGSNAFAFEMKSNAVCPADIDGLLVQRKDGSTSTVELRSVAPPLSREQFGCR